VSYVKGRADPPLLEQSVGSLWNRQVVNYTTKVGMTFCLTPDLAQELLYNGETDQRLSWRDVDVCSSLYPCRNSPGTSKRLC
jgi:hypothetical protein